MTRYLSAASRPPSRSRSIAHMMVEADREPLEPEEERHQVVGADEEQHPAAGCGKERVVLAVVLAHALPVGDRGGEQGRAREDDARQFGETIAAERIHDDAVPVRRFDVERDREAGGGRITERAERGCDGPARGGRPGRAPPRAARAQRLRAGC